jgi:membrane-bound metal-dependent hydrolase YbcI (DUF457 family)
MADFKTHTTVAAVVSAGLAATAVLGGLADLRQAVIYALAGTLGGLLPDIDADESIAIRLVFRLFGALVAGLVLVYWMTTLPHWQVLGLAAAGFLTVRYPVMWLFAQYTVHRGLLHSLLANLLFGAIAIWIGYHLFQLDARVAWGVGGFVFIGATLHLLLDEMYSVDLAGLRIKRSFGSALKLTDWTQPLLSALMLSACVGGFWLSPSAAPWQQSLGIEVPSWLSVQEAIGWLYQRVFSLVQA